MVRAVRGATTVKLNTSDEMITETVTLLKEIINVNSIDPEEIVSVFFTVTKDLNAEFPAKAARKLGWDNIALLCTYEIDVPGSLKNCIRVLLHFNTDKKNSDIKYIYLNEAKILRPDIISKKYINIAVDGPGGAGKSTIAKYISRTLGIIYLDTGAMYRAVALKAIQSGIDTRDAVKLTQLVNNIDIRITYTGNEQRIFLDGKDVTGEIRTPDVSIGASNVAVVPAVRLKLVELQREIANNNSVIMDGRDIGTYVLPNACHKFFLTASLDERTKRRYLELQEKGMQEVTLDGVRKDIEYRDLNDSTRAFAPLSKAEDAIEIDTSNMTINQVIEKILTYINGEK